MSKFGAGILVGLFLGALLFTAGPGLASQQIRLVVNGREVQCDPPPQMIRGRVFVPLRFVAEALGAEVGWYHETSTVTVSSAAGGASASVTASSSTEGATAGTEPSGLPVFRLNEPVTLGHVQVAVTDVRYHDEPITVNTIVFGKRDGMRLAAVTFRITTLSLPDSRYSRTYLPLDVIGRWLLQGDRYRGGENMTLPGYWVLLPGQTVTCTVYFYIYEHELLTGVELRDLDSLEPGARVVF